MNYPADFSFGMLLGSAICLGALCFAGGWLLRGQRERRRMRNFTAALEQGCISKACERLNAAIDAQQELSETLHPTTNWQPQHLN
jgi:hypothetical protein